MSSFKAIIMFWFVPSAYIIFEEDPIDGCWGISHLIFCASGSGYWDIWLLILGGCLPFDVAFIASNFQFWLTPIILSFKFEEDQINGCGDTLH